jgi:hypothetical protein
MTIIKCSECNKKVGLIPYNCKCGATTCALHAYPKHACAFDFHAEHKEKVAKENPKIESEKIVKI